MTMLGDHSLELHFSGQTVFGPGTTSRVAEIVSGLGASRCFVVTDPGVAASGVLEEIRAPLEEAGIEAAVFDAVMPNPTTADIEIGGSELRDFGAEDTVVIGAGGGSAMDAAKGISLHAMNSGSVADLDYRNVPEHPGLPLIAVPTTAGTGAETNGFGVVTDLGAGRKLYIGDASVKPRAAVLDPRLTLSLPPGATAVTGLDALTHALESLMSSGGNPYAEGLALQAIRTISDWLSSAVHGGDDLEARSRMLMAAHLAGLAFSSGTGLGLCHAIAHPLGARLGIVHGVALAAVLPDVMRFNLPASEEKLALAASSLGIAEPGAASEENARAAVGAVEGLIADVMGGAVRLEVPGEMAPTLVQDALEDGVISNTPRMPSAGEVEAILGGVSDQSEAAI